MLSHESICNWQPPTARAPHNLVCSSSHGSLLLNFCKAATVPTSLLILSIIRMPANQLIAGCCLTALDVFRPSWRFSRARSFQIWMTSLSAMTLSNPCVYSADEQGSEGGRPCMAPACSQKGEQMSSRAASCCRVMLIPW